MIQLLLVPLRIAGGMRIASSIGGNRDQKLIGSDGDLIPLNHEEITVLANKSQLEQWERKKNLKKILDKSK